MTVAKGRWADGRLSLPAFTLRTVDATLQGALELQPQARAGSGRVTLQAPGLRAEANGALSASQGRGNLQLEGRELASARRWLQALPGMAAAGKAPPLSGRADLNLAWQGGWRDPALQARLASTSLTVGAGEDPKAAPGWAVTGLLATLNGRLGDAALSANAQARRGQRQLTVQLAGRGGRAAMTGGAALWRGNVASLDVAMQDPAIGAGTWRLASQRPVDVRWSPVGRACWT